MTDEEFLNKIEDLIYSYFSENNKNTTCEEWVRVINTIKTLVERNSGK